MAYDIGEVWRAFCQLELLSQTEGDYIAGGYCRTLEQEHRLDAKIEELGKLIEGLG